MSGKPGVRSGANAPKEAVKLRKPPRTTSQARRPLSGTPMWCGSCSLQGLEEERSAESGEIGRGDRMSSVSPLIVGRAMLPLFARRYGGRRLRQGRECVLREVLEWEFPLAKRVLSLRFFVGSIYPLGRVLESHHGKRVPQIEFSAHPRRQWTKAPVWVS